MKRKTRTITVNDRKYVWWYKFGGGAVIYFSPFNDKTSIITVKFPLEYSNPNMEKFPEYIFMDKDNKLYCVKTIEPKMASLILTYLPDNAFMTRKTIDYNGFDLLSQMGYTIVKIQEGLYF